MRLVLSVVETTVHFSPKSLGSINSEQNYFPIFKQTIPLIHLHVNCWAQTYLKTGLNSKKNLAVNPYAL